MNVCLRIFVVIIASLFNFTLWADVIEHGDITEAEENQIIYGPKPIVISLGVACQPVAQIRVHGLRYMAYPFDWCVTRHDALVRLIKNDFAQLLDENLIHFRSHVRIWNTLYGYEMDGSRGFTFAHLCPKEANHENFFSTYWPLLRERVQRRIRRFYKALTSGKYVYFVRAMNFGNVSDIDRRRAHELVNLFKRKFPKLQFTIIAVDSQPDCKVDWHIPRVRNFYHPDLPWEGIDAVWEKIFQSVGLLPKNVNKK